MLKSNTKHELRVAEWMLILLVLVIVLTAGTVLHLLPAANRRPSDCPGSPAANKSLERRVEWYFTSGQWRGDARTAAAMVRYLLTAEPRPTANQPPVRA